MQHSNTQNFIRGGGGGLQVFGYTFFFEGGGGRIFGLLA